jgi:hypothetical protein
MSIRQLHKKSLDQAYRGRDFRYRPQYMPLNYGMEAQGVNIGDVFNVLKSGYENLFSGKDKDGDGFKDGSLRQIFKKTKDYRQNVVPGMYNYKVSWDKDTTPADYSYDKQDLFKASGFGNKLLNRNQLMPAMNNKLDYTNIGPDGKLLNPDDPYYTEFVKENPTMTLYNRDFDTTKKFLPSMTLDPQMFKFNPLKSFGLPKVNIDLDKIGTDIKDFGEDVGNTLNEGFNFTSQELGKLYNKIFREEGGELEKYQSRGELNTDRNYNQLRLLEIRDMLKENGLSNLSNEDKAGLIKELINFQNLESSFIDDVYRRNVADIGDNYDRYNVPNRLSKFDLNRDGIEDNDQTPGSGLISEPLYNWLTEQGSACNTYACAIMKEAGATYPINMEPFELYGRTYKGGDPIAIIPGNLAQDTRYDYNTGAQGFTKKNIGDKYDFKAGDYLRIGYDAYGDETNQPTTNHAVMVGDDKTIYNSGLVSLGLKSGKGYYMDPDRFDDGAIGGDLAVEYTGNMPFIASLLNQLGVNNMGPTEEKKKVEPVLPKGQYGFEQLMQMMPQFQGQEIPIMGTEMQAYQVPDFNSMLSGTTNFVEDNQAAQDALLQQKFPGLGPTPAQQNNMQTIYAETPAIVGYDTPSMPDINSPTVKRDFGKGLKGLANRGITALNRIENSPLFKSYVDLSEFAVAGAGLVNDFFDQKKVAEANKEFRKTQMADNQFGVSERTDRGLYDTNTGLLRPDMTTTTFYGKEGGEIEVDDKMLTQLIAAGADIEIIK